ncbi:anti-sigma factor [Cytophagales bacterium LB-30]|uniref:Anti-sigma factor n=1 Tax=Shiella aurantiaca TaxID=3058365 RepID=A0ABT8F8I1_9BACT|nr:anti-sigma factor [Shiella aurantiaca]MDN4166795.1 anti-sigma factor [Shiella aurantiaca]
MDIQEYISSGILETYAMGQATDAEAREVERLAEAHSEIREELEAIQIAFETYALEFQMTPPASVKTKLLETIFEEEEEDETPVRSLGNEPSKGFPWAIAASITLLLVSVACNFFFYQQWKNTEGRLALLEENNRELADNLKVTGQSLEGAQERLAMLKDANNVIVNLKGLENSPNSTAVILWNKESKDVYLMAQNLPEPSADQQYQLWAIVDGKPVDAGVFDTIEAVQQLKNIPQAQAFAITLETKGGNPSPQGTMYVLGNVNV